MTVLSVCAFIYNEKKTNCEFPTQKNGGYETTMRLRDNGNVRPAAAEVVFRSDLVARCFTFRPRDVVLLSSFCHLLFTSSVVPCVGFAS